MRRIELTANVLIIAAALLAAISFSKTLFGSPKGPGRVAAAITPGAKVPLDDVNWKENGQTILLAVSKGCHFCSDSAPFYRRLAGAADKNRRAKLIAIFPQTVSEGRAYLDNLGVAIPDARQTQLAPLGVPGTPAILLVNDQGVVTNSWVGKLSAESEAEVLAKLRPTAPAGS